MVCGLLATTMVWAVANAGASPTAGWCTFCGTSADGTAHTYDLSTLPNHTFTLHESVGSGAGKYEVSAPCGCAGLGSTARGLKCSMMLQGSRGLGDLSANITTLPTSDGFTLEIGGGSNDPAMPQGRNAVYHFVCNASAPMTNPPEPTLVEKPGGFYNVVWEHPLACKSDPTPSKCPPPPPLPPLPPPPPPTPPEPPIECAGLPSCLPSWKPTWHMRNSTVLYTCNNSGMHDVNHANQFGVVVYDWSNAKAIWANAHPMSSEELITKQAEMVYAQDPGLSGYAPRVWAYRNTIKALNWYTSVREKLDDPKYASWFIKFKGFSNTPYPGGQGKSVNGTFHVPTCDWYDNGTAPRCSGFYHDQEQTPEHPGGGPAYRVDGDCVEQCDCGPTNPCAEYIFDHRGGEVEGRTFRDWFINEYMISNETLLHKDPLTGEPQPIGLGWLDDSMQPGGPTEEDRNYIADTGASPAEMEEQVQAYQESIYELKKKVLPMGGFWWQLMDGSGMKVNGASTDQCKTTLRSLCVGAHPSASPSTWQKLQMYNIPDGGTGATAQNFTDYTAEFLLTRGPYAMLGYSWCGCTNGEQMRPRAAEWDQDFGVPTEVCKETSEGVFERKWTEATVTWDCNAADGAPHGKIAPSLA
eukprot:m.455618 g.455618  ORF g.455618 m.455618 type:complete len:638 (+) comp20907_c0_seq1:3-1916(+)